MIGSTRLAATTFATVAWLAACGATHGTPPPSVPSNTPPAPDPSQLDVAAAPEAHWRELVAAPLVPGCVAIARDGEALCITVSGGLQSGSDFQLWWLSPERAGEPWDGPSIPPLDFDPPQLDAGTQAKAVARLVKGGFGVMPAPAWSSSLGDRAGTASIDDASVPVRITWTRTMGEHVDAGDGQWNQYHDVVKSELPVACTLGASDIENPSQSQLQAWRLPGGAVLVERDTAWAIEGDRGGDTIAQVLAPGQPCPK